MRLLVEVGGGRHEIELAQAADNATLADVVERSSGVVLEPTQPVWVNARQQLAEDRVHEVRLLEGSRIASSAEETVEPIAGWIASLSGGYDAGHTVAIPGNRPLLIGRSPQADITIDSPSVSWSHAQMRLEDGNVRIKDDGSTNGTLVDGLPAEPEGTLVTGEAVITCGGATIVVRRGKDEVPAPPPGSLNNRTGSGTVPFNRPPRPGMPPEPERVDPPSRKDAPTPPKLGLIAVIAPLVMAVGMVAVMKNPTFLMFALLSPVMALGNHFESKRRRKKDIGEEETRFSKALDKFTADLDKAAAVERARRRDAAPDPATTLRRAALPTTRLWQRRRHAPDFLSLHVGVGNAPWDPPVNTSGGVNKLEDEVRDLLEVFRIPGAPIRADLTGAGVVGIVGDREGALAVARSLACQAAVHCGPADLTMGVFCDPGREETWSWSQWLPHVRRMGDATGGQWVSADRQQSESMLRALRDGIDEHPTPAVLLVIDSEVLTEGRDAAARTLLGHGRPLPNARMDRPGTQVSGIVIAASEEQLPAACTTIITARRDAAGTVTRPDDLTTVDDVVLGGFSIETARFCARSLARFDDPELSIPGASLPSLVRLPPLLGMKEISPGAVRENWKQATRIQVPVGVGEDGVYGIDLVRDGPHGLVGGTTGSGKSEFLRSVVAGLAANNDPTRLTFILIDFKGGAAFKTCERLPHTIGTVSNLDEQMAERALRALEAELRYRQQVFARAGEGIDNLDAYLATDPEEPMPRLLLVIDEFAMLAKDYPDVLKSLVSVAAVGRTLGVHMILATQRPAGVVNEDILANTNLRVALRVQSREDSSNVIGVPAASTIGRTQWGRAYIKLGQDDITPVQTALVTGRAEAESSNIVDLHELSFGKAAERTTTSTVVDEKAPTDLDLLIDAIVDANEDLGFQPPRPVWPEPLGERVELAATAELADPAENLPVVGGVHADRVEFALADEPDRQRQIPAGWDLGNGNLILLGIGGSGVSTGLTSVAMTMADHFSPDDLDICVIDMGIRDLEPLEKLPHTTAYVGSGPGAREQQSRLMKYLRTELERRRSTPGPHRRLLLVVDGFGELRDEFDDIDGMQLIEGLYRVYADGPGVGMWTVISSARSRAVPPPVNDVTTQKWLFRMADPYDYSAVGISPKSAPPPVPGRCVVAELNLHAQIASPPVPLEQAVDHIAQKWPLPEPKRSVVGQLPTSVTTAEVGEAAQLQGEPWRIPIGIRESDLEPAFLEAYEGEHILIGGIARSGKSTTLLAIAEVLQAGAKASGQPLEIWAICGRRSPLQHAGFANCAVGPEDATALLTRARIHRGPLVLLVDDCEQFEDEDGSFAGLISGRRTDLLMVVAGRSDDLRTMYSHWSKAIRKARCGVLYQPNVDLDGDLLGVTLPRRAPLPVTQGRGYMVTGGAVEFIQAASPAQPVG